MAGNYPTTVSRRAASFKEAASAVTRVANRAPSVTPRAVQSAADRMAQNIARQLAKEAVPAAAGGASSLIPLIGELLAAGWIAKEIYDYFREDIVMVPGPVNANPPPNYVEDSIPAPWDGFPNNGNQPGPSGKWGMPPGVSLVPNSYPDLPVENPATFGDFVERTFFGNPVGEYNAVPHYQRVADAPGQIVGPDGYYRVSPVFLPKEEPLIAPNSSRRRPAPLAPGSEQGPHPFAPGVAPDASPLPASFQPVPFGPGVLVPGYAPGTFRPLVPGEVVPVTDAVQNVVAVIDLAGNKPPVAGSGSYSNAPPPKGEREKKVRTSLPPRWMVTKIFNAATEGRELIQDIFKALPKARRKYQKQTVQNMVALIWKYHDEINWHAALNNILNDQLHDLYYARIGKLGGKAQQALHEAGIGPSSGPTLGTRYGHTGGLRLPSDFDLQIF